MDWRVLHLNVTAIWCFFQKEMPYAQEAFERYQEACGLPDDILKFPTLKEVGLRLQRELGKVEIPGGPLSKQLDLLVRRERVRVAMRLAQTDLKQNYYTGAMVDLVMCAADVDVTGYRLKPYIGAVEVTRDGAAQISKELNERYELAERLGAGPCGVADIDLRFMEALKADLLNQNKTLNGPVGRFVAQQLH